MYRTLLLILLLGHMLGDYYLQTDAVAVKKETAYRYVVLHSLVYAAVLYAGAVLIWSLHIFIMISALAASHFVIDTLKFYVTKARPRLSAFVVHCADQCLHILCTGLAVVLMMAFHVRPAFLPAVRSLGALIPGDPYILLQWACLLAFIVKPARVTITRFLSQCKPAQAATSEPSQADSEVHTGALIGILERIIIAILLCVGQYAAIGLVLTAKSVARFEKLKDKGFAEYYLLGTLLSTLLVIGAYLLLFVAL